MDYKSNLEKILDFTIHFYETAELEEAVNFTTSNLLQILKNEELDFTSKEEPINELIVECIRLLKQACTKGAPTQLQIVNTEGLLEALKNINIGKFDTKFINPKADLEALELISNLAVQNHQTQDIIWNFMGEVILMKLECKEIPLIKVAAMILYNMMFDKKGEPWTNRFDKPKILTTCLGHLKYFLENPHTYEVPDFVCILHDFMILNSNEAHETYKQLDLEYQNLCLYYILDYITDDVILNVTINETFLHYLLDEFKKKSDCILKTVTTYVDTIDPQMVILLLEIIAAASCQDIYMKILRNDQSLFLNLGCLLQALNKIGKTPGTIFSPIQNLEALVPTSSVNSGFEKLISYNFKVKLVKAICNLSHKNKKNQDLVREMEIMPTIFECTNVDARNPLISEWSILAIRNLCEDNLENQEMVRNLSKVGDAENPLLKELGLDMEMLRIGNQ